MHFSSFEWRQAQSDTAVGSKYNFFQKTIDITEDLWQNILVEIPLKCVNDKNKDLTLEGDGWRLISEDDVKLENNPLNSLKDLL